MSIRQIMKSGTIICTLPDARKAEAVKKAVEGAISPLVPASILQQHPNARVYLDEASAALLSVQILAKVTNLLKEQSISS